jgi:hypothetical protein
MSRLKSTGAAPQASANALTIPQMRLPIEWRMNVGRDSTAPSFNAKMLFALSNRPPPAAVFLLPRFALACGRGV